MRIALELARHAGRSYEALATKFFQHYVYVAAAMMGGGSDSVNEAHLWDQTDGFFYDVIRRADGPPQQLRVRSLVGLIPLFATEVLSQAELAEFPSFSSSLKWFIENRKHLAQTCARSVRRRGNPPCVLLSPMDEGQLAAVLTRVWDPAEFRAEHGLRSLSRHHLAHPFSLNGDQVRYEPGESLGCIKGGNSNWRGPIWFPMNFLLIESLRRLASVYGASIKIKSADQKPATLEQIADYFAARLVNLFRRDRTGVRPADGRHAELFSRPHWRDLHLFHEYFHAQTGMGLGASHQTGWTSLVANLIP
jgi:hypothetical protein